MLHSRSGKNVGGPSSALLLITFSLVALACGDPIEPPPGDGPPVSLDALPSVTNQPNADVAGSTEAAADVEITGGASTVTGTALASGEFQVSVPLKRNQENELSVVAIDATGNRGPAAIATITHDDVPPAAPTVTIPPFTNQSALTVTGTAEPGSSILVERGGESVRVVANSSGEYSASISLLPNSTNTIRVTAQDPAGNVGATVTTIVTHDDIPPAVQIVSPLAGTVLPAPPTGFQVRITYSDLSGIEAEGLELVVDQTLIGLLSQDGTDNDDIPAGTNLREIEEIRNQFSISDSEASWDFDATRWAFPAVASALAATVNDQAGNAGVAAPVTVEGTAPETNLMVILTSADPGTTEHVLPVGLTNFADLGGLNFALNFDPAVMTVDSVRATGRIGFAADSNADTHGGTGAVTAILFDVAGDPIPIGSGMIIDFFVSISGGAPPGGSAVTLTKVAASAPNGNPAPIIVTDGFITIN